MLPRKYVYVQQMGICINGQTCTRHFYLTFKTLRTIGIHLRVIAGCKILRWGHTLRSSTPTATNCCILDILMVDIKDTGDQWALCLMRGMYWLGVLLDQTRGAPFGFDVTDDLGTKHKIKDNKFVRIDWLSETPPQTWCQNFTWWNKVPIMEKTPFYIFRIL